ncbi:MAG: hypothetical protein FAF03_03880 [Epsilonproteobacteria bacterium]|nr:hypothetical protein [Campylobacterota bacterium]
MTLLVTMMFTSLLLQANAPQVQREFTVTQIALDTAEESEAAMTQALKEIVEDENETKEGGTPEK